MNNSVVFYASGAQAFAVFAELIFQPTEHKLVEAFAIIEEGHSTPFDAFASKLNPARTTNIVQWDLENVEGELVAVGFMTPEETKNRLRQAPKGRAHLFKGTLEGFIDFVIQKKKDHAQ